MFGVTTPCVEAARAIIEAAGYEVLVFHATGTGGRTMEGLIRDGLIAGVLDLATTELADELAGGDGLDGPANFRLCPGVGPFRRCRPVLRVVRRAGESAEELTEREREQASKTGRAEVTCHAVRLRLRGGRD